jgi:hypothetical protein
MVAYDSEYHYTGDDSGLFAPPGVVGSFSDGVETWIEPFDQALDTLEGLLRPGVILAGAFIQTDLAVACSDAKGGRFTGRPEFLQAVFDKYERGEIYDILIGMALDQVSEGMLFKNPDTGGKLQAITSEGMKGPARDRYSLASVHYILTGQFAKENDDWKLRYRELEHLPIEQWPETARLYPSDDARNTFTDAQILRQKGRNNGLVTGRDFTHMTLNARAAWALHLASTWGMRSDPVRLAEVSTKVEAMHEKLVKDFTGIFIRAEDSKQDGPSLKRAVVKAYGGTNLCQLCAGTGYVKSPKTGKPIQCQPCGAGGIEPTRACPKTDTGGVSGSRDTLENSGDEQLEDYAEGKALEKLRETYIPFVRVGNKVPICTMPNVLVESGRVSYEGLVQTFPRAGSIRETMVAREGTVWCSTDINSLEMVTWAEVCYKVLGFSRLAEALNLGMDPHCILAASMLGDTYENVKAQVAAKVKDFVAARQASKPGNFGFAGGMGPAKFVFTQRKDKPFAGGTHGSFCRLLGIEAQTGIRCGTKKIFEWKGRECFPVCEACVAIAAGRIRPAWFQVWEEARPYFDWIGAIPGVADEQGVIVSPGTGYIRGGLGFSAAANHCFQHLGAYGMKHALWAVSRECYTVKSSPLYGCRIVNFAHDEIITEMPEEIAHEAALRQTEVMLKALAEFTPHVKPTATPALMRRWYKAAEAVYDSKGRLTPWEPPVK